MSQLITGHLATWTTAPNGIKKLRELILELAVRGLLVPQDANDEPASELLKKIAEEKARLVNEGKIKPPKPLAKISDSEKPFALPKGWKWTRLGDVTNYGYCDKAEPTDVDEQTWVLDLEDVEKETSRLIQKSRFVEKPFKSSKNRFLIGDVIYGKLRPYLDKVLVADESGVCTTEMIPVRGYCSVVVPEFLRLVMKSPYFINYANNSTHGMNLPRLGTERAQLALIPILSETEQHRIVAKVDELMQLCDQLEQKQSGSQQFHRQLVSTLLCTLTEATDSQAFHAVWSRIAANFDCLFTTENSIEQLKQTILQLAVMGKLVPQNPNDEPASELLKNIATEKARLITEGKIKKQNPLPKISEQEKPFALPMGWEWVRLGNLLSKIGAGSTPLGGKNVYVDNGIKFLRSQNVWDEGLKLNGVAFITESTHNKMGATEVCAGDLLFNITGASIGRCALVPDSFDTANVSQHVTIIRPVNADIKIYLHKVLISPLIQQTVMDVQVGVSREGLSINKLGQFVIALPSLAEQHRIVAKVDELMSLCEQLKTKLATAQTLQQQLAETLVQQAVA